MKIPIRHAIESGAWFQCRAEWSGVTEFRLRVLSFVPVKLGDIGEVEKISSNFDLHQGKFWLLKYEAINLSKQEIGTNGIYDSILILDNEDFTFSNVYDSHLYYYSKVGQAEGLRNHDFIWLPKIKYTYVTAYFLPNEENAEYFIAIRNGSLKEV
jgi:hypothetical protein